MTATHVYYQEMFECYLLDFTLRGAGAPSDGQFLHQGLNQAVRLEGVDGWRGHVLLSLLLNI